MQVPWYGIVPFAALLLAIAVFPLLPPARHLWERRRFQLALSLALGIPAALWMWAAGGRLEVVHAVLDYAEFVTLLGALFVVSGGVFLAGDIEATPKNNTLFLAA